MTTDPETDLARETDQTHDAAPAPRWATAAAGALVALAFLLRMGAVVALHAWRNPSFMEHGAVAQALLKGDGFWFRDWGWYGPSSVQSPPYPLLLAASYKVFGVDTPASYIAMMTLNAAAGAVAVWLTYLLAVTVGRRTPASHLAGVIGAALVAVWPTQIYAATFTQAICLITAATLAILYFWQRAADTGKLGPWIGFSVIGCLAALTEPVLLPMMALSGVLILFWRGGGLSPQVRLRNAALLLLTAVVVIGPWTARNRIVHGAWIPIKSTFWVNVWKGNNPHATGTDRVAMTAEQRKALAAGMDESERRSDDFDNLRQYDLLSAEQKSELRDKSEAEREKIFAGYAKRWIAAHPAGYAKLCAVRLVKTLWAEQDNPKSRDRLHVYLTTRTLLLLATPVGLFVAFKRRWRVGYPLLLAATCLLTYTLTITAARFALPFEPLQLTLLALSGVAVLRKPEVGIRNSQIKTQALQPA